MSDEQDKLKISLEPPKLFGRKKKSDAMGTTKSTSPAPVARRRPAAEQPAPEDEAAPAAPVVEPAEEVAVPATEPEPAADVPSEPMPEPVAEVPSEPEPEPEPEAEAEEPEPVAQTEVIDVPADSGSDTAVIETPAEPTPEPESPQATPAAAAAPVAEPAPKPVVKPAAKPAPKPTPKPVAKPTPKPVVEPTPKPVAEPAARVAQEPAAASPAAPAKKAARPRAKLAPEIEPAPITALESEDAEIVAHEEPPLLALYPAAAVTGAVVGAAMVVLTWLFLRGCEAVRGTASCGGGPGFVLLVATFVVCILLGSTLLRTFSIPDPGSSSFLAVGLVAVISLLFLVDVLDHWSMLIVIPLISVGAYLASVWVTKTFVEPEADT